MQIQYGQKVFDHANIDQKSNYWTTRKSVQITVWSTLFHSNERATRATLYSFTFIYKKSIGVFE